MNYRYLILSSVLIMGFLFVGCVPAVVGGSAYGGYKASTDKRSLGTMMDDSIISTKIKTKMIRDEFVKARNKLQEADRLSII